MAPTMPCMGITTKEARVQYGYTQDRDQIMKRLNRAEGQVRGIAKMIQDDKYCIDILTQISAVQAALDKVALELLRGHAKHCLTNGGVTTAKDDDKADELVGAISRMLSR